MDQLLKSVETNLQRRDLFRRGQKILVAVSGGVDSMTLLKVLCELSPKNNWQLAVAHLNHKLRGQASDADERLVHRLTRKLGLQLVSEHADVRVIARERKISIEMAARVARHDFLARTARRLGIFTVALAHHADDQLELFFLRLFRGSGGEGLSGMKWRNPSPADAKIELVRPLLGVSKADLRKYARKNRILFREDKSNASLDFQRNRIRHELLPLLRKKYQPALVTTISRVMEIINAESEFTRDAAKRWTNRKIKSDFEKLPPAIQRRVLQAQLIAGDVAPEFELIEQLRVNAEKKFNLGAKFQVWRDASGAVQIAQSAGHFSFNEDERRLDLKNGGMIRFNGAKIFWNVERQKTFRHPIGLTGRECFDADKVGLRIILRHWRAGDRFQPSGMAAAVKLQDLFVNAKIPRERRSRLMVATTETAEIFWVEGLRISEKFKLTPATVRQLNWRWISLES